MSDRNSRELVQAFAPRLQAQFQIEASVPLEIKRLLERLRLQEMLRATGGASEAQIALGARLETERAR